MEPTPPDAAPIAHMERKALLLLGLISLVICGFVFFVLYARGVFDSTQQLVLLADDSEGISVGMDLTFSGFPIGRVERIELAPDGTVRIVIEVPRKDAHWLRTSSIFTMEKGVVGDTRIRAISGILSDPPLPDRAERTVLRGDTSAEIPRLVASTRALLEHLENMTGPGSSLNASLDNLHTVTERTNTLLAKADQRVFGKKGAMDETQAAITELTAVLRDARASLRKVDAVLLEAQAIGANTREATTDLVTLRAEVENSLRKASQLVDEINRKWPFARDVELQLP